MLFITTSLPSIIPQIQIPLSEFEFTYVRSSGPGGQNVNKVNSKAVLRWDLIASPSIPEHLRIVLLNKLALKLTTEGEVVITSDRFRDQIRNREDCIEKLRGYLVSAITPEKPRKKTKPTRGSQRRAHEQKRKQAEKKSMRRKAF